MTRVSAISLILALYNLSNVLDYFKTPLLIHGFRITNLLGMVNFFSGAHIFWSTHLRKQQ